MHDETDISQKSKRDSAGIITRIRLLFASGKLWNKVVRLSQQSEFNVETTSAIAGVRGTEFGVTASGTVLVRLNQVELFAPPDSAAPGAAPQ